MASSKSGLRINNLKFRSVTAPFHARTALEMLDTAAINGLSPA